MEDYVKTGEDQDFEYYRNDSEVLSGDGEEEPYEEVYNKKEDFNIKVSDEEIPLKKSSINRIMILSDSQPTEQIIFSLYKTVSKDGDNNKIKTHLESTDNNKPKEQNNLDIIHGSKPMPYRNMFAVDDDDDDIKKEENENTKNTQPPSGEMITIGNNNNQNENSNVLNIPSNEGSDEEGMFKKGENVDNLIVVLPPQAVRTKWFYLLLALVGIGYIIVFIIGLINGNIGLLFVFSLIGAFLIFTGIFGFIKINNKIYNNTFLFICTIACILFGIAGVVITLIDPLSNPYFIIVVIFGILNLIFSILCIIWTLQLKKSEQNIKQKQMERLVDDKK